MKLVNTKCDSCNEVKECEDHGDIYFCPECAKDLLKMAEDIEKLDDFLN